MSPHHSDKMSQRSQVSWVALSGSSLNVFVVAFVIVFVFVFLTVFLLVRSCLLITLIMCLKGTSLSKRTLRGEGGELLTTSPVELPFFVSGDAFSLFRLRKLKFWDFPVLLKWSQTFFACSQQTSFRRKQLERAELGKRESVLKEMWEMIMFCWKCKQEAQNDLLK